MRFYKQCVTSWVLAQTLCPVGLLAKLPSPGTLTRAGKLDAEVSSSFGFGTTRIHREESALGWSEDSCFFPETGDRFVIPPEEGRKAWSIIAASVIAPQAADLALLDDPTHTLQLAADHLAIKHGLDRARTLACLERLLVVGYGPMPPAGLQLLAAFFDGILSMPKRVTESGLFDDPLLFCEEEDPQAFPRRQFAAWVLADPCTPLYALPELALHLAAFAGHQATNRNELLRIGHPVTSFGPSPFLDLWLNKLYYVKVPIHENETGLTPRAAYDYRYTERRRLGIPPSALKFWRSVPEWSVGIENMSPTPSRRYLWGRRRSLIAVACGYDEADLVTGLTEDDVEWLPTVRAAVFEFKACVLRVLREAVTKGKAQRVWERVVEAMNASLGGDEQVNRLLRTDVRYAGYNALSGAEERDEVSCVPGGLTNVLEVVGHVEKELTLGTYHKTRSALGSMVVLDRLSRPRLVYGDYFSLAAKHDRGQVKTALDLWAGLEAQETGYWVDFRERLAGAFKTEIQTIFKVPVKPKHQPVVGPAILHQVGELARMMETGELSPSALLPHADKRPTAKFPTMPGLKWEEVTITFISKDSVRITARGVSEVYTFSQMGFTDRRKGDLPDKRWLFLLFLAKNGGEIDMQTKKSEDMKPTATKAVSIIRGRLKVLLGIEADPFENYRKAKGYKTRFSLRNKSHDQVDGRGWDE